MDCPFQNVTTARWMAVLYEICCLQTTIDTNMANNSATITWLVTSKLTEVNRRICCYWPRNSVWSSQCTYSNLSLRPLRSTTCHEKDTITTGDGNSCSDKPMLLSVCCDWNANKRTCPNMRAFWDGSAQLASFVTQLELYWGIQKRCLPHTSLQCCILVA